MSATRLRPHLIRIPLHSQPRYFHITSRLLKVPPKTITLEQPDKFRPPSHPQRLARRKRRLYYGKDLSPAEKEELDGKQYPYMFPPRGSKLYWFFTNRNIHVVIALSTLTFLVLIVMVLDLQRRNRYPDLLPPASTFFRHPVDYVGSFIHVYRLNSLEDSRIYREKLDRRMTDVDRRREYRRAHGLPEVTGPAAWLGLGTMEEDQRKAEAAAAAAAAAQVADEERERGETTSLGDVVDSVQKQQERRRKVFFGIWGW